MKNHTMILTKGFIYDIIYGMKYKESQVMSRTRVLFSYYSLSFSSLSQGKLLSFDAIE